MPSFLGRFLGFSFRTERLIMNIIGLLNSTLDWSPLKWTNKLEQIWNLSLSQRTLILDTIGEDTIKTVLSWIVITRIVIAHVYTFTYMTNIYPILTWSRPSLLLPWLILSFFKNVVLEVVVIAIGLLLWYDKRFSLAIFFEFILVKVVPLIFASYNWYSNSCLFLQLRYMEKMRKLKRSLRSDSNLISSRLYVKIADSKYRTRSLTTLLSYESYETYDTQDTVSRIIDDPNLTPAQKTMRILSLSEQDIADARARIKERELRMRLTEEEDEIFNRKMASKYFVFDREYERQISSLLKPRDKAEASEVEGKIIVEVTRDDSTLSQPSLTEDPKELSVENPQEVEEKLSEVTEAQKSEEAEINDSEKSEINDPEESETKNPDETDFATERRLSRKNKERMDTMETKNTKQMKLCSTCENDFILCNPFPRKRDSTKLCNAKDARRSVERSYSPVKLQSLFNCNCLIDEHLFREMKEHYCLADNVTLRTSTPNGSPVKEKIEKALVPCTQDSKNSGATSTQQSNLSSCKPDTEEDKLKVNLPEYSFGDTNIPRFYKSSMKVFDGCYEKDFANNSELQCLHQQLEETQWNLFVDQSNLETLVGSAILRKDDQTNQTRVQEKKVVTPPTKDYKLPER